MPARTKYLYSEFLLHQSIGSNSVAFMPNFEAFVMMTRSITLILQKYMSHVKGFDAWYKEKQNFMSQDEVCKFFCKLRVDVAHLKPINPPKNFKFADPDKKLSSPIINLIEISTNPTIPKKINLKNFEFTKSILNNYETNSEKYVLLKNENIDIIHLSCSYLEKLLELLDECVQQFTAYKNVYDLQNPSPK